MPQCYVLNCGNYYGKTRGNVIYHMMPNSLRLRNKWIELCRGKSANCTTYARVCSEHFSSLCYRRDLQHELLGLPLRRKLKNDAVPDSNLPTFVRRKKEIAIMINDDVKNKNVFNDELKKIPIRSSIRIAKRKSLETLNDEPNLYKKSFMINRELLNVTEKITFLQSLNLKLCNDVDLVSITNRVIVSLATYELELASGIQDFNYTKEVTIAKK